MLLNRKAVDIFLILTLCMIVAVYAVTAVDFSVPPFEDAAMLMRYSKHLADGYGIVWNIGETPVDGATDFLFMVSLAGLNKLGLSIENAARSLGLISHLLAVLLVYIASRRVFRTNRFFAWLSAAFLAIGPGLRYVEAGFGTTFFALFICLTWIFSLKLREDPSSKLYILLFSFSGLISGLIRPEGVFLAVFILISLVYMLGIKKSKKIIVWFVAVFLILGGIYFIWRWQYFGYPLPNPFYKKGGGVFHADTIGISLINTLKLSYPFWLVILAGLLLSIASFHSQIHKLNLFIKRCWNRLCKSRTILNLKSFEVITRILGLIGLVLFIAGFFRRSSSLHEFLLFNRYSLKYAIILLVILAISFVLIFARRILDKLLTPSSMVESFDHPAVDVHYLFILRKETIAILVPVIGFVLIWGLMSDEMNYQMRFQYALLPILLLSWPVLIRDLKPIMGLSYDKKYEGYIKTFLVLLGISAGCLILNNQLSRYDIHPTPDGRMEAADILKDYRDEGYTIATTEAGLIPLYSEWAAIDAWGLNDQWIAHHGGITASYLDRYKPEIIMFHADFSPIVELPEADEPWFNMVITLKDYAEKNNYELAASYGTSPNDTHYYYVRSDFKDSDEIIKRLEDLEQECYWYGGCSMNFVKYKRYE